MIKSNPAKLKEVTTQLIANRSTSLDYFLKTLFTYFFELMGISGKNELSFSSNYVAKNSAEKQLMKLFDSGLEVDFEKLVFFSADSKAVSQKKQLKKLLKMLMSNVVDFLPEKQSYLVQLISKVSMLSRYSKRIVRYAFTYISLYLFKFALAQYIELSGV